MTNLLSAKLAISLTLATNWTGVTFEGRELGYVATNHIATVTYECEEHEMVLKKTPSNIAVWRPTPFLYITNVTVPGWEGFLVTNNTLYIP